MSTARVVAATLAATLAAMLVVAGPGTRAGFADPPGESGARQGGPVGAAADESENRDTQGGAGEAEESDLGPNQLSPLMRMKLERSKAILEGLAMEDFDKISSSAQALGLLSLESGWNVIQTDEYATQSRDFRRTSRVIAEAARDQDLGRATLGYVALTVRCVECHSYMRKQRGASSEDLPADGVRNGSEPTSGSEPAEEK